MSTVKLILEQLSSTYDERNWFVPAKAALQGLSSEQASRQDGSGNHSVWQVVNHLSFWNERWLNRCRKEPLGPMPEDNDATFASIEKTEIAWSAAQERLFDIMLSLAREVGKMTEEKIAENVSREHNYPWYTVLSQIALHNAYHIGQIVTIRKYQGSWNPEYGVK